MKKGKRLSVLFIVFILCLLAANDTTAATSTNTTYTNNGWSALSPYSVANQTAQEALPSLTVNLISPFVVIPNSSKVKATVEGKIANTGGAVITARGFGYRKGSETPNTERIINTSNTTFKATVEREPNTEYALRAIARNNDLGANTNTGQSNPAITFRTGTAAVLPTSVTINQPRNIYLKIGETHQFSAMVLPINASQFVAWKSSSKAVTVNSATGLVTARGIGMATILVTTNTGNKKDTATVWVDAIKLGAPVITQPIEDLIHIKNNNNNLMIRWEAPSAPGVKISYIVRIRNITKDPFATIGGDYLIESPEITANSYTLETGEQNKLIIGDRYRLSIEATAPGYESGWSDLRYFWFSDGEIEERKMLARHIHELLKSKFMIWTDDDEKENPMRADGVFRNIEDTANGKKSQLQNGTQVSIDMRVLQTIIKMNEKYPRIKVSAITGYPHSSNSSHYLGRAVDISMIEDKKVEGDAFRGRTKEFTDFIQKKIDSTAIIYGPNNLKDNNGKDIKAITPSYNNHDIQNGIYNYYGNHKDHIHVEFAKFSSVSKTAANGFTVSALTYESREISIVMNGNEATLTATPDEGNTFDRWERSSISSSAMTAEATSEESYEAYSLVSTKNPYTFTVTEDIELVARFKPTDAGNPPPPGDSGGGGCSAASYGFIAFAIIAVVPLVLRRKSRG